MLLCTVTVLTEEKIQVSKPTNLQIDSVTVGGWSSDILEKPLVHLLQLAC